MLCVSVLRQPPPVSPVRCRCQGTVELLPKLCSTSELQLERLVQEGRHLGLVRASPRLALLIPQGELSCYQSVPPDLPRQRPGRAEASPRARAPKPLQGAAAEASGLQRSQDDESRSSQSRQGNSVVNDRYLINFSCSSPQWPQAR